MGIRNLQAAVLAELRRVCGKNSIRQKDIQEWSTGDVKVDDKAKRIAWRQLYWWTKAQLALIEMGMVETAEVMLPYMLGKDGRSFYDSHKPKLLAAATKGAE